MSDVVRPTVTGAHPSTVQLSTWSIPGHLQVCERVVPAHFLVYVDGSGAFEVSAEDCEWLPERPLEDHR